MTVSAAHTCTHTCAHTHWGVQSCALGCKQNTKFMQHQLSTASCQARSTDQLTQTYAPISVYSVWQIWLHLLLWGITLLLQCRGDPKYVFRLNFYEAFLCKFYSKDYFRSVLKIIEYSSPMFSGIKNDFECFSRERKLKELGRNFGDWTNSPVHKSCFSQ